MHTHTHARTQSNALTRVDVGSADVDDGVADGDILPDLLTVGGGIKLRLVVVDIQDVHVHHRHSRQRRAAVVAGGDVESVKLSLHENKKINK